MSLDQSFLKASKLLNVPKSYIEQGLQADSTKERLIKHLLEQRKWPVKGWDDDTIELLLRKLSSMDSNNFLEKASVGEREGRVFSQLVVRRHYGFSHGIGRSGDIAEAQPKAAGSSIMSALANSLVTDFMKKRISSTIKPSFILPMATGMSVTLALLTMKQLRPKAKYVIWSRIDQKSCYKSILTAGLTPVVIDTIMVEDELQTNLKAINSAIDDYCPENILCILTTTSCFAPRVSDDVKAIAKLCELKSIFHLINNAYGVQSKAICKVICGASRIGRVDVIIQSTDKNLMVPVGGTIVSGFTSDVIEAMKKNYPGRGSGSQSLDVLITLLSMGRECYEQLILKRENNFRYLQHNMDQVAQTYGERIIATPGNDISIAVSLSRLQTENPDQMNVECSQKNISVTEVGSMLFRRNVNGARVIDIRKTQEIGPEKFEDWGTSHKGYPFPYLTAASGIGMSKDDVDHFMRKLDECLKKIFKTNEINVPKKILQPVIQDNGDNDGARSPILQNVAEICGSSGSSNGIAVVAQLVEARDRSVIVEPLPVRNNNGESLSNSN